MFFAKDVSTIMDAVAIDAEEDAEQPYGYKVSDKDVQELVSLFQELEEGEVDHLEADEESQPLPVVFCNTGLRGTLRIILSIHATHPTGN